MRQAFAEMAVMQVFVEKAVMQASVEKVVQPVQDYFLEEQVLLLVDCSLVARAQFYCHFHNVPMPQEWQGGQQQRPLVQQQLRCFL